MTLRRIRRVHVCALLLAGVLAFAVLSNAAQAQVNVQHQECLDDGHGRPPTAATYAFYYVAPNGRDSWSGTLAEPNHGLTDGPFATFKQTATPCAPSTKPVSNR